MRKTIKDLTKLYHVVHSIFFALLIALIFYLTFNIIDVYMQDEELEILANLFVPISLFVYLTLMVYVKNKIEQKLYKENLTNIVELLLIQALLYGIITPFAILNYYILYMIIVVYKPEGYEKLNSKEDHYYYAKLFLRYGIYLYIPYVLYKYINLIIVIYNDIMVKNDFSNLLEVNKIIYLGILVFAFFQLKIAEQDLDKKKYTLATVRIFLIAIFTNPFTFHGACLIISGIYILYKDENFLKVKEDLVKLKDGIKNKK